MVQIKPLGQSKAEAPVKVTLCYSHESEELEIALLKRASSDCGSENESVSEREKPEKSLQSKELKVRVE